MQKLLSFKGPYLWSMIFLKRNEIFMKLYRSSGRSVYKTQKSRDAVHNMLNDKGKETEGKHKSQASTPSIA